MTDVSGRAKRSLRDAPAAGRVVVWLIWWAAMMALWIILDDSLAGDELVAGAAAAALAAFLAERAGHQAGVRIHVRIQWLGLALRLPGDLMRDTWLVFAALWRQLAHRQEPRSGFREVPVRYGGQGSQDRARRALLVGGKSLTPNSFVVGFELEREVMIVHQLVLPEEEVAE